MTMDREPFDTRDTAAAEARKLFTMLGLGSLVLAAVIVWAVVDAIGAPVYVGVFVGLLFLCVDVIAIAIVWYGSQRR